MSWESRVSLRVRVLLVLLVLDKDQRPSTHRSIYLRGVTLTHSGLFSHRKKTFCCVQSPVFSASSAMSKLKRSFAAMRRISCHAKFWPMQFRGPTPKGWKMAEGLFGWVDEEGRWRSGRKVLGEAKLRGDW